MALIRPHCQGIKSLHWHHNGHDGVSNHQPQGCLLNRFFRRRSKKTSKFRVTGLCVGNSPGSVNSPHKGSVTRKMFPFDDVIMHVSKDTLLNHKCGMVLLHFVVVVHRSILPTWCKDPFNQHLIYCNSNSTESWFHCNCVTDYDITVFLHMPCRVT